MIKKLFLYIIFFFSFSVFAHTKIIYADYNVSYGIFGKIGVAKAILEKKPTSYLIDIKLEATGLAKLLSGGREEHHISQGHIVNGLMISDLYQVIKSHGDIVVNKEYWVDHKQKKIKKKYKKYKQGQLVSDRTSYLTFYSKDDLLTLYFNLDSAIKNKKQSNTYLFKAVGAERQDGKVSVYIPKEDELRFYKKELGETSQWYATVIIHQQIFSSKEGRLMLGVAKDGITNKAVLKDVIFFGDIRAVRVK